MARFGRRFSLAKRCLIASWIHFPLNEVRLKNRLHHADIHLAISSQIAADLAAYVESSDTVTTIYNALGITPAFTIKRPAEAVFLYAGRLSFNDHKRVNDILLAVSQLHGSWILRIVGDPIKNDVDHLSLLKDLASNLGIQDRVEWLGWQASPWQAAGDVTVLVSSSAREAFGMTILEGCSHGVPCISSDCAGPRDIIVPGVNGWLYPIEDVAGLAQRLQQVIDKSIELPLQQDVIASVERFSATSVASRAKQAFTRALSAAANADAHP
jgi:UDP-D-galactose:(glucosyl)LPS alpha-1,6-D-galactosyltransferase